jgi:HEAT repeat protein
MVEQNLAERVEEVRDDRHDEDSRAAQRDFESVQSAGVTTVGQLIDTVNDARHDVEVRMSASSLLAWLQEMDAAPALERAFVETQDSGFAWEMAKALERLQAKRAAPVLVRALKDIDDSKRSAAAWVLGSLQVPDTIGPLWAAAMDQASEASVRGHAIEALGRLQAQEAVPDLMALLNDPSAELRYWAAYALGQIGDPTSIPALERMASVDDAVLRTGFSLREEALDALENIRGTDHEES